MSFSPFHNFFPSTQDEIESLSQILQALPTEKAAGLTYSMQDQFRRALTNLIGAKDIFLSDPDVWELSFDLAREMELNEGIKAVLPILSDRRFRQKPNSSGVPLFDATLRLSFTFGATNDVVTFWKSCVPHIFEAPHLSTQLLSNLVKAIPPDWAEFASDTRMRAALIRYHEAQLETNPEACERRFDRLRAKISSVIADRDYLAGVQKLKYRDLAFLIDVKRVRALTEAQEEASRLEIVRPADKPRRKTARPKNLRKRFGHANIKAFQERHGSHRKEAMA